MLLVLTHPLSFCDCVREVRIDYLNAMTTPTDPPPVDVFIHKLDQGEYKNFRETVSAYQHVGTEQRKELLRRLRSHMSEHGGDLSLLVSAFVPFLTDEERSVRLTTAKLFVTVAEADPDAIVSTIEPLAARLADDEEFYYVRARCAEALGYVALEHPDAVTDPEILADLRIGLSFDKSEVKTKLAKALEFVALGDPRRLRHQVDSLAEHLGDDDELVRYHLCTALVAVGCEYPEKLSEARSALADRLTDENLYVRGRAAEALGLFDRSDTAEKSGPTADLVALTDDGNAFVAERAQFATSEVDPERCAEVRSEAVDDGIGSIDAIRRKTEEIGAEITAPDGNECLNCDLTLPENGPPICPGCGMPHRTTD